MKKKSIKKTKQKYFRGTSFESNSKQVVNITLIAYTLEPELPNSVVIF